MGPRHKPRTEGGVGPRGSRAKGADQHGPRRWKEGIRPREPSRRRRRVNFGGQRRASVSGSRGGPATPNLSREHTRLGHGHGAANPSLKKSGHIGWATPGAT